MQTTDQTADALAARLLLAPAFVTAYARRVREQYSQVARDAEPGTAGRLTIHGRRRDSGQWESVADVPAGQEAALLALWDALTAG
jgi:hypothetical protein